MFLKGVDEKMISKMKKLEMRIDAGASTAVKVAPESLTPANDIGIGAESDNKTEKNRFLKPNL